MADRGLRFDLASRYDGRGTREARRDFERFGRDSRRVIGRAGDSSGREFGARFNQRLGRGLSASAGIARVSAGAIGAGLATAGLAAFAADSVKLAATFDKTMRQVGVATRTPARQIEELRKVALEMGRTTSFSAQDAGEAMLALGKGGLTFAEQKAGALSATLVLAAAGNLELGDAADYVVQGLRAFGLRADKAADVAAALAGAANASTSNVEDMGLALAQTAAGARNAGLSIEETTGVLAAFANNGIRGSDAGTSLKTMLARLVPQTEKAARTMKRLGLDFTDARGAMVPITDVAAQLQDKLGDLSDEQRSAALATIFGSDATRAATILMREGAGGLAKYIKATKDRGAAEALAKTNTEGAAGAFERLQGAIETIQIQIGDAFLPVLADLADMLSRNLPQTLETLNRWWNDNKDSIQALASILANTFVPTVDNAEGRTRTFADTLKDLSHTLTRLAIFILELVKVWLSLEHVTIGLISIYGSMTIAAGHVINAIDKLSGGTGRAGDQFVKFGHKIKDTARKELQAVRADAQRAQDAINRLKGKDIRITGTTSLQFTKSFTQSDWLSARLAAGRMAEGGLLEGPGTKTSDSIPIWASRREFMQPADAVDYYGVPFMEAVRKKRLPRFALGGKIDQTGTAHTGVGKIMDRWGTLQLAALVKNLVGGGGSAAIKAWIRAQDPKPYIWGGAGPGGFDCSGIASAVLGKMLGMQRAGSGLRLFTTASIRAGPYGLRSGLGGTLQIGVTPGRGHMAGRYGGLGFEAESTRTGIKVGAAASRPESFARHYSHMASGGLVDREMVARFAALTGADIGGDQGRLRINGRVLAGLSDLQRWAYVDRFGRPPAPSGFRWLEDHTLRPLSDYRRTATTHRLSAFQLEALPDLQRWAYVDKYGRPPVPHGYRWLEDHSLRPLSDYGRTFDSGGWLMPGTTVVHNRTGKPERALPPGPVIGRAEARLIAEELVGAMQAAGLGSVYLDGQKVDRRLATARQWNERR